MLITQLIKTRNHESDIVNYLGSILINYISVTELVKMLFRNVEKY